MLQAHIQLDESAGAKYAILPGDPGRIDRIAQQLDNVEELTFNREFRSIRGTYKGVPILAMSTGMGGCSASIGLEELKNIGVTAAVRIGSCGGLQTHIAVGDLVIACGAIRDDGASLAYVDHRYPAVPDTGMLMGLIAAANDLGFAHHVGLVHSHESFYIDDNAQQEARWSKLGALGADMETAALFTVGRIRGVRVGSILNNVVVYGEDSAESVSTFAGGESPAAAGERREITLALETLYRTAMEDKK